MLREEIYKSRYLAGQVKRYSTWPTIRQPTVAEHCWRVCCIYVELFDLPRACVFYYMLHHDSGEMWAGDIPFMVKDQTPGLRDAMNSSEAEGLRKLDLVLPDLHPLEKVKVKISDILEMCEFGMAEWNMGNRYAIPIAIDTALEAKKLAAKHGLTEEVDKWLKTTQDT
jgi:5'-deoxynucleotidase YfbR-like HD superfamily hydrolase